MAIKKSQEQPEDFAAYNYDPFENPFARSHDGSIDPSRPVQEFTFDDYISAKGKLRSVADTNGNTGLRNALRTFTSFKAYLETQEAKLEPQSGVDLTDTNELTGVKGFEYEPYFAARELISFEKEIGRTQGYSLATLEEARLFAQTSYDGQDESEITNAKALVADAEGHWHFYVLDRPIYSTNLFRQEATGSHLSWAPLVSTEDGFQIVELYTSDGSVLESVIEHNDSSGKRLHNKLDYYDSVHNETSNRQRLNVSYIERFGGLVHHILSTSDTPEEVLKIQPHILALSTPEQKAQFIKALLSDPDIVDEPYISRKIIDIFEVIPGDSGEEVDQLVAILKSENIYELIFFIIDGPERMQLIKVMAQKGLTQPLPDFSLFEGVRQGFKGFGHTLAELVEMLKHPEKLLEILDIGLMAYHLATGGNRVTESGDVVSVDNQLKLAVGFLSGKIINDGNIANELGYGDVRKVEMVVRIILEAAFLLWGGKALIASVKKGMASLQRNPVVLGSALSVSAVTFVYNKLKEDEFENMKDYEKHLAVCIEKSENDWSSSMHIQPAVWFRRNIMGVPIRSMSHYTSFEDGASEYHYQRGIEIFQEMYGPYYTKKILSDIREINREGANNESTETEIRQNITDYIQDNKGLVAILNVTLEHFDTPILTRVGIYEDKPCNFDLLYSYLNEIENQDDLT